MAYCTSADVLAIVDTDMSAAEVTDLITRTDERIDMKIDSGAASATFLEDLSATWTAYRVMLKDPNARRLGEYSEDRATQLKLLKDEIDNMLAMADGGLAFIATRENLA